MVVRTGGDWLNRAPFDPISDGQFVQLLVCDGDQRLGDVSLAPTDERCGWATPGDRVHPDNQGEASATETIRLVVTHGSDELRLHRISGTVLASSEPSSRVLKRPGFVPGTNRDDAFVDGEYAD